MLVIAEYLGKLQARCQNVCEFRFNAERDSSKKDSTRVTKALVDSTVKPTVPDCCAILVFDTAVRCEEGPASVCKKPPLLKVYFEV